MSSFIDNTIENKIDNKVSTDNSNYIIDSKFTLRISDKDHFDNIDFNYNHSRTLIRRISNDVIKDTKFTNCKFYRCGFINISLINVVFQNCVFDNCYFNEDNMYINTIFVFCNITNGRYKKSLHNDNDCDMFRLCTFNTMIFGGNKLLTSLKQHFNEINLPQSSCKYIYQH